MALTNILTIPAITQGQDNSVSVDKSALALDAKVSGDAYFSDQNNWKTILINYQTPTGDQTQVISCDATIATPVGNFNPSSLSRDDWEVQSFVIMDFDGGSLEYVRSEMDEADFDIAIAAILKSYKSLAGDLFKADNMIVTGRRSVAVWFKADAALNGTERSIVGFGDRTGTWWEIIIEDNDQVYLQTQSTHANIAAISTSFADGNWHHLYLDWQGAGDDQVGIYFDGALIQTPYTDFMTVGTENDLFLGANSALLGGQKGWVADLAVITGVNNQATLASELYNSGVFFNPVDNTDSTATVTNHWTFGENAGDTTSLVIDEIGGENLVVTQFDSSPSTAVITIEHP